MVEGYTIGKVAELSGVSIGTIRFYERKGLTAKARRNASGYRIFSQEMLERICFIKWSRDLGFSLQEISELIPLFLQNVDDGDKIRGLLNEKIRESGLEIANLSASRNELQQVITTLDRLNSATADGTLLSRFIKPKNKNANIAS
jgi:MerR family mercuric resistance operon transcriptional regulator